MDIEDHQPFPHNKQELDFDNAKILAILPQDRNINGNVDKKLAQCAETSWSHDGKLLAWACGPSKVEVYPVENLTPSLLRQDSITLDCRQAVTALTFVNCKECSSNMRGGFSNGSNYRLIRWEEHNEVLVVGLKNGRIRIFDVDSGDILMELLDHTNQVTCLNLAPDKTLTLVSSSFDGTIKFWDLEDDGNMATSFTISRFTGSRGAKYKVTSVVWSPDAKRVAAVGTFKTVVLFDMEKHKFLSAFNGHVNHVNSCEFSPDGILLITASVDTTALVWNSYTGEIIAKLGHQFPPPSVWCPGESDTNVLCCKFAKNGMEAVTVSDDGYVRFWDLSSPGLPSAICRIKSPLCGSFSVGGDMVAVGTSAGTVEVVHITGNTQSLINLCRVACNKSPNINFNTINTLPIPTSLKRFLRYETLDI